MRDTISLAWICFALVAFGGAAVLSLMAPEVLASDWMPLLVGTFFVVVGCFSLFRAKAVRDESLEGAECSRRWLEHPYYVFSLRIMGAIGIVVGVGLLYLLLTQPSVPASR